jgi:hypothetical protein
MWNENSIASERKDSGFMANLRSHFFNAGLLAIAGLLVGLASRSALAQNTGNAAVTAPDPAASFRCPEDYPSSEAAKAALDEFVKAYAAKFPDKTINDFAAYRYQLLASHSCTKTLQNLHDGFLADITPATATINFNQHQFGPRDEEFDPATKVWTEYFDGKSAGDAGPDEELIFNFYGWRPPVSATSIAETYINRRDNIQILGKFQAPDEGTKAPAYFIVSETTFKKKPYGYLNIGKVTSIGDSAYMVTFTMRIFGANNAEIDAKARAWYSSAAGQAASREIGKIGVNQSWQEYLSKPHGK